MKNKLLIFFKTLLISLILISCSETNKLENINNVLLFGSEGRGLSHQIKKNSDFLFRININKNVESLNISNSASVVFHHLSFIKKKS